MSRSSALPTNCWANGHLRWFGRPWFCAMANAVCSSTHTQQLSRSKTTLWAVWGRQAAREARTKDCREAESPRGFAPTLPQATKRAPGSAPVNDWCCRAAGGFAQPKEKAWSWLFGSQERRHRCNVFGRGSERCLGSVDFAGLAAMLTESSQSTPASCACACPLWRCLLPSRPVRSEKRPTFPCVKKYSFIFFLVCARSLGGVRAGFVQAGAFLFFFAPVPRRFLLALGVQRFSPQRPPSMPTPLPAVCSSAARVCALECPDLAVKYICCPDFYTRLQ